MTEVDTNVVVRLLTADHPAQHAAARALFAVENVWIAKTVLLETAWVLRSAYSLEETAVVTALAGLLGLPTVQVEDPSAVASAMALSARGLDFADALHLTSRPEGASFVSFDKALVKRATRAGVTEITQVPRAHP